jgi:hypothetical protein
MSAASDVASVRWTRAPSVIARRVAGETVLVPLDARASDPEFKGAQLYVLNETGEFLWSLLDTPRTAGDLARNLTLEFETAEDRALADVEAFLVALRDIGAVREASEPRPK